MAILTINRPDKLNALNQAVRDESLAHLQAIEKDDSIGAVVITGAGEKSFIAGADIQEFAGRSPFDQREAMAFPRVFDVMANFPKPVIAMINGFCLGGGCELAMSCDIRVASDKARFGQPEIKLGLIPGGGGTQRLPRLVGMGNAMRLILTGDMIGAAEALADRPGRPGGAARRAARQDPRAGRQDRRASARSPCGWPRKRCAPPSGWRSKKASSTSATSSASASRPKTKKKGSTRSSANVRPSGRTAELRR